MEENTNANTQKEVRFDHIFEIVIAVLLGITALLTSYASWQSSLYGGNQATKYARGTAIMNEANAMINEASMSLVQDMQLYSGLNDLRIDLAFAEDKQDADEIERLSWKIDELMNNNMSDELTAAVEWALSFEAEGESVSPFAMEGFVESYYEDAYARYDEGEAMVTEGQSDNHLGDVLGLSTVIYSIVLFLLGIVNTFVNRKTKLAICIVSAAALIFALVIMLGVPMITL